MNCPHAMGLPSPQRSMGRGRWGKPCFSGAWENDGSHTACLKPLAKLVLRRRGGGVEYFNEEGEREDMIGWRRKGNRQVGGGAAPPWATDWTWTWLMSGFGVGYCLDLVGLLPSVWNQKRNRPSQPYNSTAARAEGYYKTIQ